SPFPYPYGQGAWIFRHMTDYGFDLDPLGVAFGWTDKANARGVGLPMIMAPLMNTIRRWSMKQGGVVLSPGPAGNTVYCHSANAGVSDGGGTTFADLPTFHWPHVDTRVSIDVEFATPLDLSTADVRVVGYTFVKKPDGSRNIVARIVNAGSAPVTVTLVWHFEAFVTNWDGEF